MKFTDAHSSSSVCTPTRYGILTGRYSWRSKLKENVLSGIAKALIPTDRTTIAKMLQNSGYATAFIGKWHLGWNWNISDLADIDNLETQDFSSIDYFKPISNNPNDLGFTYAYGISGSLDLGPYVYVQNGKVLQIPDTVFENKDNYEKWRKGTTSKDFVHEQTLPNFVNKAIEFVEKSSKNKNPFFIYLPLPAPHTPFYQQKNGKE